MKLYEAARITRKNGMSINVELIVELAEQLREGAQMLAASLKAFLADVWETLRKRVQSGVEKRHKCYKLDLIRVKMHHQVLCRKPKRLIKKIIQ